MAKWHRKDVNCETELTLRTLTHRGTGHTVAVLAHTEQDLPRFLLCCSMEEIGELLHVIPSDACCLVRLIALLYCL